MKILFLDIDGVVCLHDSSGVNWGENSQDDRFDEGCCRRLKEIIDATGCKLVLSSSWRLNPDDIRNMLRQFAPFGITKNDFIGKTPELRSRAAEIMAFVRHRGNIDAYIAVDDEDFRDGHFYNEHFVLTQENSGITEEIKRICIRKLNI